MVALGAALPAIATAGMKAPTVDLSGVLLFLVLTAHVLWRLERADGTDRVALLWLGFATASTGLPYGVSAFTMAQLPSRLLGLALMSLVPPLLAVGIRRPLLVDVRGLITEAVVLGTAMIAYMCLFVGVTTGFEMAGVTELQVGALAVIGALAAAGFHPLRLILRAAIDELLFGERPDPLDAASRVAGQIGDDPALALDAILQALVLPYASLRVEGEEVADLQVSRGQAIAAIEDERRRLRRDLHDGLGATLSGIAFTADAARNSLAADPGSADALLRGLRADAVAAIGEVRRLVYGMRPPALDELGLVPALRQWTLQVRTADGRPLRVDVDPPDELAALPAAVEVAAYRITVEALTNVARHSRADRATGGHVAAVLPLSWSGLCTPALGPPAGGRAVFENGFGGGPGRRVAWFDRLPGGRP